MLRFAAQTGCWKRAPWPNPGGPFQSTRFKDKSIGPIHMHDALPIIYDISHFTHRDEPELDCRTDKHLKHFQLR